MSRLQFLRNDGIFSCFFLWYLVFYYHLVTLLLRSYWRSIWWWWWPKRYDDKTRILCLLPVLVILVYVVIVSSDGFSLAHSRGNSSFNIGNSWMICFVLVLACCLLLLSTRLMYGLRSTEDGLGHSRWGDDSCDWEILPWQARDCGCGYDCEEESWIGMWNWWIVVMECRFIPRRSRSSIIMSVSKLILSVKFLKPFDYWLFCFFKQINTQTLWKRIRFELWIVFNFLRIPFTLEFLYLFYFILFTFLFS